MKRIGLKALTLSMVALLGLTLNSCKKEPVSINKSDTVVMDANEALEKFDATYAKSMKLLFAVSGNTSFKNNDVDGILDCADIVMDTFALPYHATFNFGSGCVDNQGTFRSGVVQLEFNEMEYMRNPGSYVNATFNNYVENSDKMNGTFEFINNGLNTNNNLAFGFNLALNFQDVNTSELSTINGSAAYEFIGGQDTETDEDDFLALTGQLNGEVGPSTQMVLTILQPVISSRAVACEGNFIQGEVKIEQNGQPDRFIDYGNGDCDDQATQTVNGVSTPITLDGGFE